MDAALAGLLGVLIGAGVALLDSFITGHQQRELEREKTTLARREALSKELRGHVAAVARSMLSAQHSMEWLTWQAVLDKPLTQQVVGTYHQEIHRVFPRLLGEMAVVASANPDMYDDLVILAERIYAVDGRIAEVPDERPSLRRDLWRFGRRSLPDGPVPYQ